MDTFTQSKKNIFFLFRFKSINSLRFFFSSRMEQKNKISKADFPIEYSKRKWPCYLLLFFTNIIKLYMRFMWYRNKNNTCTGGLFLDTIVDEWGITGMRGLSKDFAVKPNIQLKVLEFFEITCIEKFIINILKITFYLYESNGRCCGQICKF